MNKKERYAAVIKFFEQSAPDAQTELHYTTPFELLVAVILSAQCTDKRVNQITPALFKNYPNPKVLAAAKPEAVFELLRSVSYPNSKSRNLVGMANMLMLKFNGRIPKTVEELIQLPGVGRKTANVVLGHAFGIPGITVDTHFGRLSRRFKWTKSHDPVKVEFEIQKLFPEKTWTDLSMRLIWHGRRFCTARSPKCSICPIAKLCPSYEKN